MGRPKKRQRVQEDTGGRADVVVVETGTSNRDSDEVGRLNAFDDVLTPRGGNLQPWVQTMDWNTAGDDAYAMPALTNVSPAGTPPAINLHPELLEATGEETLETRATHNHPPPTMDLTNPTNQPKCACLSTLYLTLSSLETMDPNFPFPFVLQPLRQAMQTATEVLSCPQCPQKFISAIQNTQLAGTLLMSLADRFGKVLEAITTEANRASEAGEGKKFHLADLTTSGGSGTSGLGCATAFSIELSPEEWRPMCKKVVRAEVFGPNDGNGCCNYLIGVVERMESRQEHWHDRKGPDSAQDFPKDKDGVAIGGSNIPREDHVCLKLCAYARKVVAGFDWR
ncbi:hypothetical protein LTR62_008344 [Meristemomyces frigidus]|uniref:Uncharacterized protein n=1 Tax=Meristemomyces frigidus TaxID=1508187 RepID=A0AAN7TAP6_9PEZI|nr:hypothetical protein LTR62_008344 [Meristemomyces frigidus]